MFFENIHSVHIKLDKDLQKTLKMKLFAHGLTMQDFFKDIVENFVNDETNETEKKLQKLKKKLLFQKVENFKKKEKGKFLRDTKIDVDVMYNLLEGQDTNENRSEE